MRGLRAKTRREEVPPSPEGDIEEIASRGSVETSIAMGCAFVVIGLVAVILCSLSRYYAMAAAGGVTALLGILGLATTLPELRFPRYVIVRRGRMLIVISRKGKRYVFPIAAVESVTCRRKFFSRWTYLICLTVREIGVVEAGTHVPFPRLVTDRLEEIIENDASGYYE